MPLRLRCLYFKRCKKSIVPQMLQRVLACRIPICYLPAPCNQFSCDAWLRPCLLESQLWTLNSNVSNFARSNYH